MQRKSFDSETDSLVELTPGSALTRLIPLSRIYDLQREGTYEVAVTYQPDALSQAGDEPPAPNVYDRSLRCGCGISFTVPLKKPAPPAPPKAAEKLPPKTDHDD